MLNFLSPRGRISRAPYALAMLVILLLLAATVFVPALGWVRAAYEDGRTRFSIGPGLPPAVPLLWLLACLQLNRIRDMGVSSLWALAPIAVLAIMASVIQLTDGFYILLLAGLMGDESVRRLMPITHWPSFLAMAWAGLSCLGGIGWLALAPGRKL